MLRVSAKRVSARAAQIGSQLDHLQVLTENEDAEVRDFRNTPTPFFGVTSAVLGRGAPGTVRRSAALAASQVPQHSPCNIPA